MKERPILMSTEMVKAILEGRKTQTRRVKGLDLINAYPNDVDFIQLWLHGIQSPYTLRATFDLSRMSDARFGELCDKFNYKQPTITVPYGQPGDILWVRETWGIEFAGLYLYKASHEHLKDVGGLIDHKWKPSIHMPKVAARIWLQIESIRCERLEDISPSDACDEGVEYENIDKEAFDGGEVVADFTNYAWKNIEGSRDFYFPVYANPVDSYFSLWAKINGWDSVDKNPWLWAIKFKVLSTTGRPALEESEVAHG